MSRPTLIVLAKAPVAGHAKTRLTPPLSPAEAADLAAAALHDTLDAAGAVREARVLLVLDGAPGPWLPQGFDGEFARQRTGGLAERIAGAFESADGPALLVGMDTPQLTAPVLDEALAALGTSGTDAVLGPAHDGGYWAIGLRRPDEAAFSGIPMSTSITYAAQRARLAGLGMRVADLVRLRDVDTIADAREVAAGAPSTRFAAVLNSLRAGDPAGLRAGS